MIVGRLFGIGVGPGDPELITLKAARLIERAPVVAFVSTHGRPSLARQVAEGHLAKGQRQINITLPLQPYPEIADAAFDEGASRIGAELEQGRDVAFLCDGDPLFHSAFIQIFERIGSSYASEIVPGITPVAMAAAAARRPLAGTTEIFAAIPACLPRERLLRALAQQDCAAIFKIGEHLAKVRAVLAQHGLVERAVYLERVGTREERIMALADLQDDEAPNFSVILIPRRPRGE